MDSPTQHADVSHLSLCTGYEGIGLGLRKIFPTLREIAFVEREAYAAANLVAKIEKGELAPAPVWTDVRTFPYRDFYGLVDIFSAGFPCQPFSVPGKLQSTKDPRHLFPHILRGIRECRPAVVFLENVEGIFSTKTGEGEPVLKYVLGGLEEVGYRATGGIFSADEVGAPHLRRRVFIMAYADEPGLEGWNSGKLPERSYELSFRPRSSQAWPSRQFEPQRDWERQRKVEPGLGGATTGTSQSRVDRLIMLGNGVVADTAAKAFVTLAKRLGWDS
tara:strand:+ start:813 stop:1637 length:825 start_codon:yes stop_codon:yes gene_type:complete